MTAEEWAEYLERQCIEPAQIGEDSREVDQRQYDNESARLSRLSSLTWRSGSPVAKMMLWYDSLTDSAHDWLMIACLGAVVAMVAVACSLLP